ncbi:hypothetical protein [Halomicrobium katesii]|uniref:hypothetical protein n=1 Tax=Halomicrobium katesii TaxID=437163 RepID=UPI00035CC4A6|nr:hypothetical protein [Halomicrobium katesii]
MSIESGRTLIVGPANVGKTTATGELLEQWLAEHGTDGVVALDFAPEVERDGRILGGRLDRVATLPAAVDYRALDAHAPRSEGADDEAALARDNADRARALFADAPDDPTAVFVNDATIPFQADGDIGPLCAYCGAARLVVANAFASDELGTDDPVSRHERTALTALREWADRVVTLQ